MMRVTLSQLEEMAGLKHEGLSPATAAVETLSIALDMDPADVSRWSALRASEALGEVTRACRPSSAPEQYMGMRLKPLDTMTLGEFIDLNAYAAEGRLAAQMCVMYRFRQDAALDMQLPDWEPYSKVDVAARCRAFGGMDAGQAAAALAEMEAFRVRVIEAYPSIFPQQEPGDDDAPAEESMAWESLVLALALDDVTKWEDVCRLPLFLALNIAAFRYKRPKTAGQENAGGRS
jgi:hypothetical protein